MQRQKYRITMADDTEHVVTITNRSEVAFEREAHMRGWPLGPAGLNLAMTYKAWWQLVKIDQAIKCTYEDFEQNLCDEVAPLVTEEQVLEGIKAGEIPADAIEQLRADGLLISAGDVAVDPTQTGATPGS